MDYEVGEAMVGTVINEVVAGKRKRKIFFDGALMASFFAGTQLVVMKMFHKCMRRLFWMSDSCTKH